MGKLSKHTRKRLFKLLAAMGMFGLMAVWDRVIPQNTAWRGIRHETTTVLLWGRCSE